MAHCTRCGAALADGAAFCASCGSPQTAPTGAPPPGGAVPIPPPVVQQQMAENVAGLLCYVLGWITGLIFYFVDKRPFVRFHAAQSIVTFGGIHVIQILLTMVFWGGIFSGFGGFSLVALLWPILGIATLVLWILLMVKAYGGERFRVPIAADLAEKIFGKS